MKSLITVAALAAGVQIASRSSHGLSETDLVVVVASVILVVGFQAAYNCWRALTDAHKAHAREMETFGHMVETLPLGVCTFREGQLVSGNRYFGDLVGDRSELRGNASFERSLHPQDKARVLAAIGEAQAFDVAFRMSPSFGDIRHVEARGVTVRDERSGEDRVLAYFLDVTDTARAEAAVSEKQESLEGANRLLREAVLDLDANFQAMVQAFVKVVEAKDPYTAGHSERVMAYSMWVGEAMGLRPDELRTLRMGCLVHDVGKIGVPDSILTKPEGLSEYEYAAIRQHPAAGVRIIENIPLFQECMPIVRGHHERLDGTGYPDRLSAEQIPTLVRIAAVADCFDAMTSTRAYRNGMDVGHALGELRRDAARGALDPEIVDLFGEIIHREGLLWAPVSQAA